MAVCGLENGLDDGLIRINDEPQIKEPNSRAISRLPLHAVVPYWCTDSGPYFRTFKIFHPYRYFRGSITSAGLIA